MITEDPQNMIESHRTLATELPGLLQTWEVQPGQLTLDLSDATSGMAAAMVLAGRTASSQVISLCQGGQSSEQMNRKLLSSMKRNTTGKKEIFGMKNPDKPDMMPVSSLIAVTSRQLLKVFAESSPL